MDPDNNDAFFGGELAVDSHELTPGGVMHLEAQIEQMVREAATQDQVLEVVDGHLDSQNGRVRHADGIDIEPMASTESDASNAMHAWMKRLDIAAAPEVVTTYRFGVSCLAVRRYWACPGEKLIKLSGSGLKLHEDARKRFAADMQRLFEHDKLYPYIRGDAHWLVSET